MWTTIDFTLLKTSIKLIIFKDLLNQVNEEKK